jgi:hypothetical protein
MSKTLLIAIFLVISSLTLANQDLEVIDQPNTPDLQAQGEEAISKVREIEDFDEFMNIAGQEGTNGTVTLICGIDSKMENNCKNITLAYKQFQEVFPEFNQEFLFYDLNKADFRITGYFDIERIPHIMLIKDRRVYIYRYKTFSMTHLASFLKFFEENPDAMWRHFPTQQRSKVDYFVEGLYRLQDRIYLIANGMTWAIYSVYAVFVCLLLMLIFGILIFLRDAASGRLYAHLEPKVERKLDDQASASDQAKNKPSATQPTFDSIKVKNY